MKTIYMAGRWKADLYGPDGNLKQSTGWGDNVVVTVGKEFLARFLYSATTSSQWTMKYVAIGTDSTSQTVGDTALIAEVARHTGTASYTSGGIYEVVATFATAVGTGAIVEYGLLSANAAGTLLARDTEAVINKGASDTLTVTAQITIG
jgi:hypothetical protein